MLKHATTITVIGFLLFFVGIVSFVLNYVGVDLVFLDWLYRWNPAVSYAVRILMILVGLIMIYIGRTDWSVEEV